MSTISATIPIDGGTTKTASGASTSRLTITQSGQILNGGTGNVISGSAGSVLNYGLTTQSATGGFAGIDFSGAGTIANSGKIAGHNSLVGGSGNDTLAAGAGVDTLVGGAGNGVFFFYKTALAVDECRGGVSL